MMFPLAVIFSFQFSLSCAFVRTTPFVLSRLSKNGLSNTYEYVHACANQRLQIVRLLCCRILGMRICYLVTCCVKKSCSKADHFFYYKRISIFPYIYQDMASFQGHQSYLAKARKKSQLENDV